MEDKATKIMIAMLQKHGYDLEVHDADDRGSSASTSSSSARSSSGASDHMLPRNSSSSSTGSSTPSSATSILQLRDRKNQQTALHIAVKKGHMDVLRALAKLPRVNEFVNVGDRHANTALHFAASSTKECAAEMVELLFTIGASLHAVNIRGQTPLMTHLLTAREDNPAIAKLFVKKGLLLHELVDGSTTYLHMAIAQNLVKTAGALVAGGASINIPDSSGAMVSDIVPRKVLVRLISFMKEGTQSAPLGTSRSCCKMCKAAKGLLESFKDCNLCGRVVCKNCSTKTNEVKAAMGAAPVATTKEKDHGRLCNVCCTVVVLRDKQHKAKEGFNQRLFGCGMK